MALKLYDFSLTVFHDPLGQDISREPHAVVCCFDVRRYHVGGQIRLLLDKFCSVVRALLDLETDDLLHRDQLAFPQLGKDFGFWMRSCLLDCLQLLSTCILNLVCLTMLVSRCLVKTRTCGHTVALRRSLSFLIHPSLNALPWPTLALSLPTIP